MSQPNKGLAASVRQRLLNIAEQRGENYNLVLRRYVLERFLYRLGRSPHRSALILKGAMLFQVWSKTQIRATKDLDFLAYGQFDESAVTEILWDICVAGAEHRNRQRCSDPIPVRRHRRRCHQQLLQTADG